MNSFASLLTAALPACYDDDLLTASVHVICRAKAFAGSAWSSVKSPLGQTTSCSIVKACATAPVESKGSRLLEA